jgi:hypothetical protein
MAGDDRKPMSIPVLELPPPRLYDKLLNEEGKLNQAWQDWISPLQIAFNQMVNGQNAVFTAELIVEAGPVYKLKFTAPIGDGTTKSVSLTLT